MQGLPKNEKYLWKEILWTPWPSFRVDFGKVHDRSKSAFLRHSYIVLLLCSVGVCAPSYLIGSFKANSMYSLSKTGIESLFGWEH